MKTPAIWHRFKKTRFGQFILLLQQDLRENDISNHAYSMAYVTLFSLVPSLAAIFALISLFTPMFGENSSLIVEIRQLILKNLATGSGEQAIVYFENFLANTDFKKIGMTGFAGMIVTLSLLLRQIEMALNRIFEISKPRTLLIRFIYFWTFLTLGTFSLAIAVGALSSTTWGATYLETSLSLRILNEVIYCISLFAFFFVLYKVVPNRFIPTKHAAIGGLVSAVLLGLGVRFFSLYISHFTKYEAIYGALAALPIFLFWLYILWSITLLGASVTKRSMEGIVLQGVKEKDQHPHLQSSYFHSLLPLLSLVKIYKVFSSATGDGASIQSIADEYSVSIAAARHAIHQLLESGFIVANDNDGLNQTRDSNYFPRVPLEDLCYKDIRSKLLGSESQWLATTRISPTEFSNYQILIHDFLEGVDHSWQSELSKFSVSNHQNAEESVGKAR